MDDEVESSRTGLQRVGGQFLNCNIRPIGYLQGYKADDIMIQS